MTLQQTDPRVLAEQVDEMLQRLQDSASPVVAEQVEDLVRALSALYGAGLGRAVEIAVDHGGEPLLRRLADDDLVGSLLAVHDLHPDAVEQRVQAALDQVVPSSAPTPATSSCSASTRTAWSGCSCRAARRSARPRP